MKAGTNKVEQKQQVGDEDYDSSIWLEQANKQSEIEEVSYLACRPTS